MSRITSHARVVRGSHYEDLTLGIYGIRFDEYYTQIRRARAVQVYHARLFGPYKGPFSRRTRRTPNYLAVVVKSKSLARVSAS